MLQLATFIKPTTPTVSPLKNKRTVKAAIEIEIKLNRNLRQQCIYYKPFSFQYITTINGTRYRMQSSSASIIKTTVPTIPDATYMMNVRLVNYHLTHNGEAINHNGGDKIMTLNKILYLNKWFEICGEYWVPMLPRNVKYNGIEDVRLMSAVATDEAPALYYIGSYALNDNKVGIVSNITTTDAPIYQPLLITPAFKTDNNWEKNWVFFNMLPALTTPYIIYKWSPLYICQIKDTALELIKSIDTMPPIFAQFRGSTNGVNYGNRIWFITHFHHFVGNVRKYLHCFVVFNNDMELLGYSNPFNFCDKAVEYCIGMVENNDNFIITFSTLDKTTELMVIPINYIARNIFGSI